jgi:hypothetical protein
VGNSRLSTQRSAIGSGIEYVPYLYSTGLIDRAWPRYRKPIEDHWRPYVEGKITLDEAIARTIAALGASPSTLRAARPPAG